jgi:prolipoprotein diacylglyceryltransferase
MVFDALAWLAAAAAALWFSRVAKSRLPAMPRDVAYLAAVVIGATIGAYLFGSLNLWLSGQSGIARSIEGAVAGGIIAVELYKWRAGIRTRTGARFALLIAVGVAVGRIGCYLAGLDDFTYGTPTTLPWAHDFGDGVLRHPVQLYESAAMAACALAYALAVRRSRFILENGFYLVIGFYGLQRFLWEFFKPYGTVLGPFTLFHLLSAAIVVYAAVMITTAPKPEPADDRAFA